MAASSDYEDGFKAALAEAIAVVQSEHDGAAKEIAAAKRTGNFNPATIAAAKTRRDRVARLLTSLRKLKP
jgi:hypothetical protein